MAEQNLGKCLETTARKHGVRYSHLRMKEKLCTCQEESNIFMKEITFPLVVKMDGSKGEKIPPVSSLESGSESPLFHSGIYIHLKAVAFILNVIISLHLHKLRAATMKLNYSQ